MDLSAQDGSQPHQKTPPSSPRRESFEFTPPKKKDEGKDKKKKEIDPEADGCGRWVEDDHIIDREGPAWN
jgi:hypothetical protein